MSKKKIKKAEKALQKEIDNWPFPTPPLSALNAPNVRYFYIQDGLGGYSYSFAYRPAVRGNRCRFIELAVAVCSPSDNFSRKKGRMLAESRLLAGNFITVPLAGYHLNDVPYYLNAQYGGTYVR